MSRLQLGPSVAAVTGGSHWLQSLLRTAPPRLRPKADCEPLFFRVCSARRGLQTSARPDYSRYSSFVTSGIEASARQEETRSIRGDQHQKNSSQFVSRAEAPAVAAVKSTRPPGRAARLRGGCTIEELVVSAKVAKLCDFIYSASISGPIAREGLTLITEGHNKHTRWYVADQVVEDGQIARHVIIRGVVWGNDQVDRMSLMQRVASVWPRHIDEGASRLLCHSGVLQIAEEVWEAVLPFIRGRPKDSRLSFAGHSLGGSLALLLTVFARMRLGIPPSGLLPTHLFGSPPVLTLTKAEADASGPAAEVIHDGRAILRELQLPEEGVRWFVADHDLVPRLWNAADPMYAYVRRSSALVRVLQWREQVFGGPMLTDQKFLYDMVGRIFWIKWPRNQGVEVFMMTPEQAEVELKEHPEDFIQPTALFRSAMDHSRRNYTYALESLVMLHRRGV